MSTATLSPTIDSDEGFTLSRIKEGDMAHALLTLSRQYSRPREAVIRELATNALESHQAAGCTDPVVVILPTDDPFLTIADHGLGLDLEDITDVIGDFAGSTKRHAGQATPNHGIGSKSPFAVGDSYTVTAVKDGICREVLFARLSSGNPGYKILSTTVTNEQNGVTVRVPVPAGSGFLAWKDAAENVFYWWDKGTFQVEHPDRITFDETVEITTFHDHVKDSISTENVFSIETDDWRSGDAVMIRTGTAGYSVPEGFFDELDLPVHSLRKIVVEMPKDSIKVSPNRESIEDTEGNRKLIYAALEEWAETVSSTYLAKMAAATSSYNLYRAWKEATWTERILTDTAYLRLVEDRYDRKMSVQLRFVKYPRGGIRKSETLLTVMDLDAATKVPCLVLEELDNRSANIIARWRSAHGKEDVFVFHDREDVRPLIDPDELAWVTLDDLKAETPAKRTAPAPVVLSDTDTVDRVWYDRGFDRGPIKYKASIGELKKLIADGLPLVIGKSKEYSGLDTGRGRLIKYDQVVAVACKAPALSKLIQDSLGQKASTPEQYRHSLYLREIENLDDEQKQAVVERATLPVQALRHARYLTEKNERDADGQWLCRYSEDLLEALKPLTSLGDELDPAYAQLPGMPEPRLGIEFKHVIALLDEIYAPSELLLKMALRADTKAAGDRRRRRSGKTAGTK